MTSKLKADTARANGAKPRGPKSPATREKSSRNSLRHGFTSRNTILLACEDPDLYQRVRTEYNATYQPATPVESDLVDEMVASRWRILRIRAIETALIDSELLNQGANIRRQIPGADAGIQLALAFRCLVDDSRALSLASRYESRLHRILCRAHQTLRELQAARKTQSVPSQTASLEPANPDPDPTNSLQAPQPHRHKPLIPSSLYSLCQPRKILRNEPTHRRLFAELGRQRTTKRMPL